MVMQHALHITWPHAPRITDMLDLTSYMNTYDRYDTHPPTHPTCSPNKSSKPFQYFFPLVANIAAIDSCEKTLVRPWAPAPLNFCLAPGSPGPAPRKVPPGRVKQVGSIMSKMTWRKLKQHMTVRAGHFPTQRTLKINTNWHQLNSKVSEFSAGWYPDVSGIDLPLVVWARMPWKEL